LKLTGLFNIVANKSCLSYKWHMAYVCIDFNSNFGFELDEWNYVCEYN